MKMKHVFHAALCAATLGTALAGGEGWTQDFEAAKAEAAKEKESLLIDFTGSDWCGWCIKLNEEVFQEDAFKEGIKDKFVLVELDYPRDTSKLSEETQEQNAKLQEAYAIQGFPTILLTDEEGRPFARTGYQEGGAEAYVKHLDELLKNRTTRDEAFEKASHLEGPEKANALISALDAMGLDDAVVGKFYGGVVDDIKAADPEDTTGFVKEMEAKERYAGFESKLNEFGQKGDHEGALSFTEETLKSGAFEGAEKQQIATIKAMILAQLGRFDDAATAFDEAKAVDPDSEMGQQIDGFKQRVAAMAEQGAEDHTGHDHD
ncbi:thioredoxin-related protein [Haloferula luteola]|uniref:Thioredoxin-related protein n=1 Tax=Haloferula luteola TaxID=595692 RepID=A0A840VAI6_9BACT|nr:thioredoxin family protein [Haloferula luteola]MBB5352564.1 thioredoxin-related protein [Haloferula luteola]